MFKNLARTVAPLLLCLQSTSSAQSVFTSKLDDPKAVYLKPPVSDSTDDTVAIQTAIDEADTQADEGIVFIPSGRYRLTHTAYVWPGVRVFGYGGTRPVFLLPAHTPGFETGMGTMVIFAGARPGQGPGGTSGRVPFAPPDSVPPNPSIADANSGTFYSAMSNIDFEIGDGNPAAVAIRFHVAQHAYLSHMNFTLAPVSRGSSKWAMKRKICMSTVARTAF